MNWYHYLACFFAGAFLTNAVPHFVKGICGDRFPTPFAKPPGKGLSSPLVNVVWGLFNLILGYVCFVAGRLANASPLALGLFCIAMIAMSIALSLNFARKHSA